MIFSKSIITFIRGDDDVLLVALSDGITFKPGDKVFFSLKDVADNEIDIFQIESTTFVPYNGVEDAAASISIPHEATIELDVGDYYYDILIEWADGTYATVIRPTKFKLVPGGSHDDTV